MRRTRTDKIMEKFHVSYWFAIGLVEGKAHRRNNIPSQNENSINKEYLKGYITGYTNPQNWVEDKEKGSQDV